MIPRASSTQRPADLAPGLRRRLTDEYGGLVPDEAIARAAEKAVARFEAARIRDYVPVLAWRHARRRLRRWPRAVER